MNTADFLTVTDAHAPGSIAGACSVVYHEHKMTSEDTTSYKNGKGVFSQALAERVQLQGYTTANIDTWVPINDLMPTGTIIYLEFPAIPHGGEISELTMETHIEMTGVRLYLDSQLVKELDHATLQMEKYQSGFKEMHTGLNACNRLFLCNTARLADKQYCGGLNCANVSTFKVEVKFANNCRFRVINCRLARFVILSSGQIKKYLA